jgi:hypothetical protein
VSRRGRNGRSISITHRRIRNDRLAAAQRHLFNKLIGQLYHCLQHHQTFDSGKAFPLLVSSAAA